MTSKKKKRERAIAMAHAQKSGVIPEAKALPVDGFVKFSFKYLYFTNKFCLENGADTFPKSLLERLKAISALPINEFRQPSGNPKALRSHLINFSETTEKSGFVALPAQLWTTPWQFEISQGGGRVHGFLAGDVFCVVWLDPAHCLYA